jgi:hypothetical protein
MTPDYEPPTPMTGHDPGRIFCEWCGTALAGPGSCGRCGKKVGIPVVTGSAWVAVLVAVVRMLADKPLVGSILAGAAAGLLVAPLFHLFQRGGVRPMTAGRGRDTWKLDGLAGALVVAAIGAATWPPAPDPDTSWPEIFVITFLVLPMLIAVMMSGVRRIGLANARGPQDACPACGWSMRRYDRFCQACGSRFAPLPPTEREVTRARWRAWRAARRRPPA